MLKKVFYLLLLLPLGFIAGSCDDDNDLPDVGLQATISQGVVSDNTIYVVQGETLQIDAVTLVNNTGKDGAIGVVNYYIDGLNIGQSVLAPYAFSIETANLPVGTHTLTAEMPVYVVDYPICFGAFSFTLQVVENPSDLPGEPAPAVLSGTIREK